MVRRDSRSIGTIEERETTSNAPEAPSRSDFHIRINYGDRGGFHRYCMDMVARVIAKNVLSKRDEPGGIPIAEQATSLLNARTNSTAMVSCVNLTNIGQFRVPI